jgi:hypothetical protein
MSSRAASSEQDFITRFQVIFYIRIHERPPKAIGSAVVGMARSCKCAVPRRRIKPTNMPIVMAEASSDEPP